MCKCASVHDIEPYFNWRHLYTAEEDERSPFFGREYSEFEFSNRVYNYLLHPQWDEFGSPTLFMKLIFADYDEKLAVMELIGEWNDVISNDIMILKRDIIEKLMAGGIRKFILIGENVLNFHPGDDDYYAEWKEELEEGWVALVNLLPHVKEEFQRSGLHHYLELDPEMQELEWRKYNPTQLRKQVELILSRRLPK